MAQPIDRKAFRAKIVELGQEFSMDMVEATNAMLAPLLPAPDESRTTRDIAYGPHERHRLNLFRPAGDAPAPCLLFVHDGGFVMGDKGEPGAPFYNNLGAWAQGRGIVAATMNYRLAPEVRSPGTPASSRVSRAPASSESTQPVGSRASTPAPSACWATAPTTSVVATRPCSTPRPRSSGSPSVSAVRRRTRPWWPRCASRAVTERSTSSTCTPTAAAGSCPPCCSR